MVELELSIMNWRGQDLDELRSLLDQFEAENNCQVRVRVLSWERGYSDLVNFALHQEGPDVFEVGTTWCAALAGMNVLRSFTPREVIALGGSTAFLPTSWQTCLLPGDDRVWAIPRLADIRILFYRRDLFEKAGVDEQNAFRTHQQIMQSLERLRQSGVENPIVFPTVDILQPSLHILASWIWGMGGHILSPDGKKCLINSSKTQAGIRAHLELSRYLSPAVRGLDPYQAEDVFWKGNAAIAITLRSPIYSRLELLAGGDLMPHIGAAPILDNSFVGGTNYAVWKHVPPAKESLAVELVHFLSSPKAQSITSKSSGLFPPSEDLLAAEPFTDPFYVSLIKGMRSGRTFRSTSAWGTVEDQLLYMLARFWEAILSDPQIDVADIVAKRTESVKRRLDLILESYD